MLYHDMDIIDVYCHQLTATATLHQRFAMYSQNKIKTAVPNRQMIFSRNT